MYEYVRTNTTIRLYEYVREYRSVKYSTTLFTTLTRLIYFLEKN